MTDYSEAERKRFLASRNMRASSANVIIENSRGELLVVKAHYKKYWSLPGGWIDDGESPLQAALREVAEEVGLVLDQETLELEAVINRVSQYTQTYLFVFKVVNSTTDYAAESLRLQSDEITAARYVTRDEIRQQPHLYNTAVNNWAANPPRRYSEVVL